MIKNLQRKFIMIAVGSLAIVMVILVGSINAINLYQMNSKLNGAITILSENQGRFPKFEKELPRQNDKRFGFEMDEETQFAIRYFTVDIDMDGDISEIDTSHIAAVSSDEAAEYARKVLDGSRDSGYAGIYKFKIVDQADGAMIIFINCKNEIETATLFLLSSGGVAIATLFLVFVLVSVFSRKAIKPIIESMEKQKQFITDAGHEIKTPLAIISANTDVLELTGGESEWIASIRNQVVRLDKLVRNLLMLSKMDEDEIKRIFTDFDLSRTVDETASPFRAVAEMQNKKFIMDIQPGLMFRGDESSISQLVSTLVDNAMKYSDEEGTIKVSLHASKKGIKLEVFNTVEKIEQENLEKLFDRFYRADSSRSRDTGGYGIGLSIARSIVEAHHGKISAKSMDGKSICFTVKL